MLRPNDKIGPYKLIRKLGRGTFGVVWLAEKRSRLLTTNVALKIPNDDEVDLEAVRAEASIWLHAAGHPNILPIIDADIYDDQVVIVSEYAPGGSLTAWLSRYGGKAPSVKSALEMVDGILAGLEHLHSRNIVHRDLKPDNILLQGTTPRLADFGIARVLRNTTCYSTIVSGTPKYMAPETYQGRRSEQTDLWAVGVVLHQLLSASWPFPQDDPQSLMYAVISSKPQPLPSSVPDELKQVVAKALEKDCQLRYRTAAQMRYAIQELIRGSTPLIGPQSDPNADTLRGASGELESSDQTVHRTPPLQSQEAEETQLVQFGKRPIKQIQQEYWLSLNTILRKDNSVLRLEPAPAYFEITGFVGHPKVKLFATANIRDSKLGVGIRIFNRKDIYQALEEQRESIDPELSAGVAHESLVWRERKNYQTISEISVCNNQANISWHERWTEYLEWHRQKLESFYRAFEPRIRDFSDGAGSGYRNLASRADHKTKLVQDFWDGFDARLMQAPGRIELNKPNISSGGGGKSWRSKSVGRGFNFAAQLNASKNYVDVNITVGSKQHPAFLNLHSQRKEIEREVRADLEWRLNPNGESWVMVRRNFDLSEVREWESIYEWLLEQLKTFQIVLVPRIRSLNEHPEIGARREDAVETDDPNAKLIRLINSVGKSTFVDYYHEFADRSLSNREIVEILPKEYTSNSRNSKVSCAKRIFREGKQIEALEIIAEARNVSDETRRRAGELLSQISTPSSESVTSDADALHRVMIDAKKRQFWIVLWGDPARRLLEETQVFDQPTYDQGFPVNPSGIQIGDILFVHRIGISKISFVAEALTTARKSTSNEIDREEWRKRWIWSVKTRNLTPEYGLQWSVSGQRTFDLLERYNSLNPDNQVSISGIKFGRHVRIPQPFAEFLIDEIQQVVIDAS